MLENFIEFTENSERIMKEATMYCAVYRQRMYEALLVKKNVVTIITKSPITESSTNSYGLYYTDIDISECESIYQEELYASYNGKIYKVVWVGGNFENFMLETENVTPEEILSGFKADFYTYSKPFAIVDRKSVDKLFVKKNKLDVSNAKVK